MKKRGGKNPFSVAWVENAELLEKKSSRPDDSRRGPGYRGEPPPR